MDAIISRLTPLLLVAVYLGSSIAAPLGVKYKGCGSCGDEPVDYICSSDGHTYRNLCQMEKVACKRSIVLEVVHLGRCMRNEGHTRREDSHEQHDDHDDDDELSEESNEQDPTRKPPVTGGAGGGGGGGGGGEGGGGGGGGGEEPGRTRKPPMKPNPPKPGSTGGSLPPGVTFPPMGTNQPGDPNQPGGPNQPGDPNQPGGPNQPGDPNQPGGPNQPGDPNQPGGPNQPGDPNQPGGPNQPGDPNQPGGPNQPGVTIPPGGGPNQPGVTIPPATTENLPPLMPGDQPGAGETLRPPVMTTKPGAAFTTKSLNTPCATSCPLIENAPVCGTDGITYTSECVLKAEACMMNDNTLQVAYQGPCLVTLNQAVDPNQPLKTFPPNWP